MKAAQQTRKPAVTKAADQDTISPTLVQNWNQFQCPFRIHLHLPGLFPGISYAFYYSTTSFVCIVRGSSTASPSPSLATTMSGFTTYNPRGETDQMSLLSSKDPLSLPIMTNNLKSIKTCSSTRRQGSYPQEAGPDMDEGPQVAQHKPMSMIIQRLIDNDRLTDECWNSEMRQVELWENERYNGPMLPPVVADVPPSSSSSSSIVDAMRKGWGKQHLKSGERGPWTRSRDDVSAVGVGNGVDASGEVSNLTFSLAPHWSFVESEDWRKDLQPTWSGCGCDPDGWLGPRPAPYTSGGGSVTRRRRWIRRVWYNQKMAEADS